jgi:hypothetical protein
MKDLVQFAITKFPHKRYKSSRRLTIWEPENNTVSASVNNRRKDILLK